MINEQSITGTANIGLQDIRDSTININQYLGKSGEYKALVERFEELKKWFESLPETKTKERREVGKKIELQKQLIEAFKQDVIRLAGTFQSVAIDTERLRQAKQHFEAGEFKQTDKILNAEKLCDDQQRLLAIKKERTKELEDLNRQLRHNATEYLVKAQVTALNYSNSHRFEDTRKYYELSISSFPFIENLFSFAYFLQTHNQVNEAESLYRRILVDFREHLSPHDRARTLNNLATLHHDKNEIGMAEGEFKEALTIRRTLATTNPEAYLGDVARTLNNLANLHKKKNEIDVAEGECKEALEIQRNLVKTNPRAYLPVLAEILNNFAILHKTKNEIDVAEGEFKEALMIRRTLIKNNPGAYLLELAGILNNLANLHKKKNEIDVAEGEYKEALTIRRELAKTNPRAYLPAVAATLNNLAILHQIKNEIEVAEGEYKEAIALYRDLAKTNPEVYLPYMALTLHNLAVLHFRKNEYEMAEGEYKKALKIRRNLAKTNPGVYLPAVAETLVGLAVLHAIKKKIDLAEGMFKEAIALYRDLAKANPEVFLPFLANTLIDLSLHYADSYQKREQSVAFACEGLRILLPFAEKAPYTQRYVTTAIMVLDKWGA